MWIYASAPDVQVFHVDKNAWLLFLVGIYSCTVWRELWEAVPASTAVVWQVINVFHIIGVGREKKILRVFHFFSPFPLSFLLWTSLFSVLQIFFPSTPIHWYLPRPVSADGFFFSDTYQGLLWLYFYPLKGLNALFPLECTVCCGRSEQQSR